MFSVKAFKLNVFKYETHPVSLFSSLPVWGVRTH